MIILDISVVSELIRAAPDPDVRAWVNSRPSTQVATTAILAAELHYGVARLPAGHRRQQLAVAVSALLHDTLRGRIARFDERAARRYADVITGREQAGRPIGVPDAQIAAICRELGAVLATRNIKDFEETGVEMVDPWQADKRSPGLVRGWPSCEAPGGIHPRRRLTVTMKSRGWPTGQTRCGPWAPPTPLAVRGR